MPNPRLATRYAKSLLDLAVEQNAVDSSLQDINLIDSACQQSREFCSFLRSPIINADKKTSIINAVMGEKLSPMIQGFVKLLIAKGREENLPEIASAFLTQYKVMKNIKTVKLTTAVPVTDVVKQAIMKQMTGLAAGAEIEVKEEVNPDIIGGFILQMDDKLIDASVRRDLQDVKAQFQKNIYISPLFN